MKQVMILGALVVLALIVAGCVGGQQTTTQYVCPDGTVVTNQADCPAPSVEGKQDGGIIDQVKEVKREAPAAGTMDSKLAELKAIAARKIKSVKYNERFSADSQDKGNTYYVNAANDKFKVHLANHLRKPAGNFDVVYINKNDKTAVAKCEFLDRGVCTGNTEEILGVFYADYKDHKTLFDWLDDMDNGVYLRDSTVENRQAKMFEFVSSNGKTYTVWLDSFYGSPLRIESEDGSEHYFYYEVGYNGVSDADLTP